MYQSVCVCGGGGGGRGGEGVNDKESKSRIFFFGGGGGNAVTGSRAGVQGKERGDGGVRAIIFISMGGSWDRGQSRDTGQGEGWWGSQSNNFHK